MICTHPDIVYSVGVLSRHIAFPGKTLQAIKHMFCYLRGTSHYKLEFQSNDLTPSSLKVFVDSDWAEDRVDRKSISGLIVMLDQGAAWGSKTQTSVSLSTMEAKFVASTAVREILWHISLFHSLDMTLTTVGPKSGQINDRTKHLRQNFSEEARDISGVHVATEDQMADIMTKSLGPKVKQFHFPLCVSKLSCSFFIDYISKHAVV